MLIGYARVSKSEGQDTAVQVAALKKAGAKRVFEDKSSGARRDRPELQRLLDHLRPGDVLIVWKLDRLSRSLRDLIHIMEQVNAAGAAFRSLTEAIDTTTAAGRMLMQMLGSIAEFEREIIQERTRAGLAEARQRGRVGGRRHKLSPEARAEAVDDVLTGRKTMARVARAYGVHPSTIGRLVARCDDGSIKDHSPRCTGHILSPALEGTSSRSLPHEHQARSEHEVAVRPRRDANRPGPFSSRSSGRRSE
ncbi:MAG: recombinase family protein [Methylobacterium sp.]|nr:recombinase family protein [Methylobacterium sp.]MCA3799991.1 recombinase family protein [Burkholderia sp.]